MLLETWKRFRLIFALSHFGYPGLDTSKSLIFYPLNTDKPKSRFLQQFQVLGNISDIDICQAGGLLTGLTDHVPLIANSRY
jgi:hypothetical protein